MKILVSYLDLRGCRLWGKRTPPCGVGCGGRRRWSASFSPQPGLRQAGAVPVWLACPSMTSGSSVASGDLRLPGREFVVWLLHALNCCIEIMFSMHIREGNQTGYFILVVSLQASPKKYLVFYNIHLTLYIPWFYYILL